MAEHISVAHEEGTFGSGFILDIVPWPNCMRNIPEWNILGDQLFSTSFHCRIRLKNMFLP